MAIFPLSPDIQASYPSHSFGSPSKPIFVSFQSLLYLGTHRFWGRLPVVTLNLHFYETRQEKESKPISHYLIPYKKDLPFDIVELVEEIEKNIKHLAQGVTQPVQIFVGWSGISGTGCPVCPSSHCGWTPLGSSYIPIEKTYVFSF